MWNQTSSRITNSSHDFFDSLTSNQAQGSAPGFTTSNAGGTSALFSQQQHNDVASSFENAKAHDVMKNNMAAYFTSVDTSKPAGQTWPAQFVSSPASAINQSYNNIHQQPEQQNVAQSGQSSGVYSPSNQGLHHPPIGQNSDPFVGESNHINSAFPPPSSGYNWPNKEPDHPPIVQYSHSIQSGSNHVQPSPTQLNLSSTMSPPPSGKNPPSKEPQHLPTGQTSEIFLSGGNYVQSSSTAQSWSSTISPPPSGYNTANKEPQRPPVSQNSDSFLGGGNHVQPSPTQLSLNSAISPPPPGKTPPEKEPHYPPFGQNSDPFLNGGNHVQPSSSISPPLSGYNPPNREPQRPPLGQNSDPFLSEDTYGQPTPPNVTTTISSQPSEYNPPNKEPPNPPIGQNSDPFPSGDIDVPPSLTPPTLTSTICPPPPSAICPPASSVPLSLGSSLFPPRNEETTAKSKEAELIFPVAPSLAANHADSGSDDISASQKPASDQPGIFGGILPPEIGNTALPTSASKNLETNANNLGMIGNSDQNMSVASASYAMESERITDRSTTAQPLFSQPSAELELEKSMSLHDVENFASIVKPPSVVEHQPHESTMDQQEHHSLRQYNYEPGTHGCSLGAPGVTIDQQPTSPHQDDIKSHLYPPGVTKASLDAPPMTWSGVSCQTQGLYPPGAQETLTASSQAASLAVSPALNRQHANKDSHVGAESTLQRDANTTRDGRVPSHDQQLGSIATFGVHSDTSPSQKHLPPSFDVQSKTAPVTFPEPSPVAFPEGTGHPQDSPANTDPNIHTSAFHPVKSNSPYNRPDLESPLRSPVQREKRETILHGSKYQTSSLWDNSDPQLAIPGLVVPIATKGNRFELVSGQDHRNSVLTDNRTQTSQQAASSNIGALQHAMYGGTGSNAKRAGYELNSHPTKEARAKLSSLPSTVDKQNDFPISTSDNPLGHTSSGQPAIPDASHQRLQPLSSYSGHSSTSTVSRQSSIGVSSQDQVNSEIAAADKLSGLNKGNEQRPSIDQAPSVSDEPSGRSGDHAGLVQNKQALTRKGDDGGVASGVGDGHVNIPAGNRGALAEQFSVSDVRQLQHKQQLGYQHQQYMQQQQMQLLQQREQQQLQQRQIEQQQTQKQPQQLQQQQKEPWQQQQHPQPQQQQQRQQQLQEQQQLEQLRQQLYGQQHMDHQQRTDYEQYMQHQQQLEQHQLLQRQTSGQYQQQINSNADEQYQTNTEQQQYEDYDSEEECNRYYDESGKWFWSNKRHKWIRADKSKRDNYAGYQDQRYYDDRYRSEARRSRYEDDDRGYGERRHGRRRDPDPRRQSRVRSEYDYDYLAYYDNYYRDYYQRTYQRGESDSSDSSADSQHRGTRSGHSSRGQSPHSTSSRSSSRARRSNRKLKSSKSHDYTGSYRREEEQYRSQQSSRSSRRLSSASNSSSTSNSLSDNIKWNDQPKQQENDRATTEYAVERAVTPERLTPKQHTVPHVVCKFGTVSRMSITPARRVLDGETPQVILTDVTCDPRSSQLMQNFPGPLCRGKTHKRDIVKFTKEMALASFNNQNKSFEEREASYILWEVLAVMVQQNGVYLNSDIAEVLTSELPPDTSAEPEKVSPPSSRRVSFGSESHSSLGYNQDVLNTYREYLLCGKTQDALEFAIKSKMWGHALTLAYQLDKNIFFNIMSRFTDNLSDDDSLLCLYQHLSQQRPSAVDKKSKRWRKHLAMMIANPSKSPAQDIKNIHALGKNLESRGLIEAAHLCYIVAGETMSKENEMILLGYSLNGVKPEFADLLAIQRTEIYEYAMRLRDENFIIKDFQPWKEFYANKLADEGLHNKAYRYCETMVENVLKHSTLFTEDNITRLHTLSVRLHKRELITPVLDMNDKLKRLLDLTQGKENMTKMENSNQQQSWPQYWQPSTQFPHQSGARQDIQYEPAVVANGNQTSVEGSQPTQTSDNQIANISNSEASQVPTIPTMFVPSNPQENTYYPESTQGAFGAASVFSSTQHFETTGQNIPYSVSYKPELVPQEEFPATGNYSYGTSSGGFPSSMGYEDTTPSSHEPSETRFFGAPSDSGRSLDFYEGDSFEHLLQKQPSGNTIDQVESSGLSTSTSDNSFDYYAQSNFRNDKSGAEATKETATQETKEPEKSEKKDDKKKEKQGGGWSFGGFFKALIPKGKNEMILPDDKKKTIYWDEKEGKWVNTEADEEDKTDLPPPPIDPSLNSGVTPAMPSIPSSSPAQPTPTSVTSSANHFNQPDGSVTSSNTPQPPVAQAPPVLGNFTPDQPEDSLINTPLTTPSRFSRRALGSKARKSNYVDVLSASGSTTKLNNTASPMLFQPFPTTPGNQAPVSSVPDNQPNMDDTARPPVNQNNGNNIGNEQPNSTQASQPPAMSFFNPADFTAASSSSNSRSRLYPKAKK